MTKTLQALLAKREKYKGLTVEQHIQQEGQDRYEHGLAKYGVTLDGANLTQLEWLQHHKEELFDAIRYVECQMRLEEAKLIDIRAETHHKDVVPYARVRPLIPVAK